MECHYVQFMQNKTSLLKASESYIKSLELLLSVDDLRLNLPMLLNLLK